MKKMMKFVKGKREDESVKNEPVDSKKVVSEKVEEVPKEDDFISRDKSITKLHKAVWHENSDKLKTIIKTHDIDITDKLDRTALYFAILKNNPNIVDLLLDNKANQNIPDIDGITPFLKSVQLGFKQCAAILLQRGADVKKTDKDLNSCLHFAVMENHADMLPFLLKYHADPNVSNANGEYPLHIAVKMQNIQMIASLLDNNADIRAKNSAGQTPLTFAIQYGDTNIISILEEYNVIPPPKPKRNIPPKPIETHTQPKQSDSKPNKTQNEPPKIEPRQLPPRKHEPQQIESRKAEPQHSDIKKVESDVETWNDSPVSSPRQMTEKPQTKVSKFFNEETDVSEQSESDVSIKCSENTSPQSGIIPPPCKPLRSLEYLQSGLAIESSRPVHLLTLGTVRSSVRTRHISMTESDRSKTNTPHRYSYQGDLDAEAKEKDISSNVSVKSKILSKLDCDVETLQSDWGSNESLPLDELDSRKDKATPKTSAKNNDFLQKQFSILEDYEKKHSGSRGSEPLDSNDNLDDISHLLEDNNRINAQLEKYAGQSDHLLLPEPKSKSLPRNCEPYNSYHNGSFSLPRTLDSGVKDDAFREMRSYGYFKPRSHFFSLKLYKGEKKATFMEKLKSMFNKKAQIHDSIENSGTWLYRDKSKLKNDSEFYAESKKCHQASSSAANEESKRNIAAQILKNECEFYAEKTHQASSSTSSEESRQYVAIDVLPAEEEDDDVSLESFMFNEPNKIVEKKFLSVNSMSSDSGHSRKSSGSQSHSPKCNFEGCLEDESKYNKISIKNQDARNATDSYFCEDCSDFLNLKLADAEQTILGKDTLIKLLQAQLDSLKERNVQSINEAQAVCNKYCLAKQELVYLNSICKKYEEELQRLRVEKSNKTCAKNQEVTKFREEAEKWKKQYEDLIAQVNQLEKCNQAPFAAVKASTIPIGEEDHWRSIIQSEVANAVTLLKENSKTVISSLEKHNKKLEEIVEKLQIELNQSSNRQQELETELISTKKELSGIGLHKPEEDLKHLQKENKRLQKDLDNMSRLYDELRNNYESNVKKIEKDIEQSSVLTNECEAVKQEFNRMKDSIGELTVGVSQLRDSALFKTDILREKLKKSNASVIDECYLNNVTSSLRSIEMRAVNTGNDQPNSKNITDQFHAINVCRNAMCDIEKLNIINSDLEIKLKELELDKDLNLIEEENDKLKHELLDHSKLIENLEEYVQHLQEELASKTINDQKMQQALEDNSALTEKAKKSLIRVNSFTTELIQKEATIQKQNTQLLELNQTIEKISKKSEDLTKEVQTLKMELDTSNNSNYILNDGNEDLQTRLSELVKENNKLESDNENLQDTLDNTTKDNGILNVKLSEALKLAEELQEVNEKNLEKLETFEKINKDLKLHIDSLTHRLENTISDVDVEKLKTQISDLCTRNCELKAQHAKDKTNNDTLAQRVESLKFYHNNEARASAARFDELQLENDKLKEALQSDLNILRSDNTSLMEKLGTIKEENQTLRSSNTILNSQLEVINKSLSKRNTAIDKSCPTIGDNDMEACMNILKHIIDEKPDDSEHKNKDKHLSLTSGVLDSTKNTQKCKNEINKTSKDLQISPTRKDDNKTGKKDCCESEDTKDIILDRLSSIEKQVHAILKPSQTTTNEVKSTSMPNLDSICEEHHDKRCQTNLEIIFSADNPEIKTVRKSSSLEIINSDDKLDNSCKQSNKNKWDEHLEIITKLRTELMDIIEKLNLSQTIKSCPSSKPSYSDHYKQVIENLQRQVNELTIKSAEERNKCYGLEAQLQGLKGEMVQKNEMEKEITKLRKEMSTQKYKKVQEIEAIKIQKEAEMINAHQKIKEEYLDNKEKLLSDLLVVQQALQGRRCMLHKLKHFKQIIHFLQAKTDEEIVLRKKCSTIVKDKVKVTYPRLPKPSTSGQCPAVKFTKPVAVQQPCASCKIKPHASTSSGSSSSSGSQSPKCCRKEKPKVPLKNARDKLNTTIEKHRISSDPAPVHSVQDEELKKKYNIK